MGRVAVFTPCAVVFLTASLGLFARASAGADPPTAYNAVTDRVKRDEPSLPVLGGAGFTFRDPTFGSRLVRVTDAETRPDRPDRAWEVTSSAEQRAAASSHARCRVRE